MREIKYRAWLPSKEMFYLNEYHTIKGDFSGFYVDEFLHGKFEDERPIFMQYVGLKDKNGKEIYEGDIIKWTYSDGASFEAEVVWKDFVKEGDLDNDNHFVGFMLKWHEDDETDEQYLYTDFPMPDLPTEVIGNIYKNPELLKED